MFKNSLLLFFLSFSCVIQSSNHEDYNSDSDRSTSSRQSVRSTSPATPAISYKVTTSSTTRPTLTAEQLQAIKKRQMAVISSQPAKIKIGTASTVYSQLYQQVIYDARVHKGISFDEFAKKFSEQIEHFIQQSQGSNIVEPSRQDFFYDKISKNPISRSIDNYEIVGEMPDPEFKDTLFYVDSACKSLQGLTKNYIDMNFSQVRAKCIQPGLTSAISQEVWKPCICGVQLHRSCFKQCRHNGVTSCVNPYCQKPAGGLSHYSSNWTPATYARALEKPPIVPLDQIKEDACPVCLKSLVPTTIETATVAVAGGEKGSVVSSTKLKKRKRNKNCGSTNLQLETGAHE